MCLSEQRDGLAMLSKGIDVCWGQPGSEELQKDRMIQKDQAIRGR